MRELSPGGGAECMNQGHTGLVVTVKARIQLFCRGEGGVVSKCSALPPPGPPSSMYLPGISHVLMKHGPTLISTKVAGMREGYKLPRAVFATEEMVNKSSLYQGSPFTT